MRPIQGYFSELFSRRRRIPIALAALAVLAILTVASPVGGVFAAWADRAGLTGPEAPRRVVATGLLNPRGVAFGPDGSLYVAEAGAAGRERVVAQPGKRRYRIGKTGRVSRLVPSGQRETVIDELPSVLTSHDDDVGPAGVAVVDGDVYVLTAAGGWSWGDPTYDNAVLRLSKSGALERVFDYGGYNLRDPSLARRTDPRADVPGGMPFGMTSLGSNLYTTDGNHEFVLEIRPDGEVRRLLEYPQSNRALTGIASGPDGALYIAEFGPYPYPPATGQITRLDLDGRVEVVWGGLTTPIGVAVGPDGALFAVEFTAPLNQWPETGRVLRRDPGGDVAVLATGLDFPTAVAFGPDGNLYVANKGHHSADATGEIVQLELVPPHPLSKLLRLFGPLFGG